jgi:hypothetical protein
MDPRKAIHSQYLAALSMLKQAVFKCPPSLWDSPRDRNRFWFTAYHALYFAHLYLQPTRKDFVPWRGHGKPTSVPPLTKEEILEYVAYVEREVALRLPVIDLNALSGFQELRVDKLELQLVTIRHIQHHTGELYERLGSRGNVRLSWTEQRRLNASRMRKVGRSKPA